MHNCPDCGKPCNCYPDDDGPDDCIHDCESENEDDNEEAPHA
jgi:hypothetical protein